MWSRKEIRAICQQIQDPHSKPQAQDPIVGDGLLLILAGTFAVVSAYFLDGSDSVFNRSFNSHTFGPRFVLNGAATVIAKFWSNVELSTISSTSATLVSSSMLPTDHYAFLLDVAGSDTRILKAAISLTTLFSEILNILISIIPYSTGQVIMRCIRRLLSIQGNMMVAALIVIWRRKYEPSSPSSPRHSSREDDIYIWLDEFRRRRVRDKKVGSCIRKRTGLRASFVDEVEDKYRSELI